MTLRIWIIGKQEGVPLCLEQHSSLVIVISLVCSGHYAIFKLLHLCFKIEKVWISIVSGVLLAILALSFLPAAILVRHFRSPLNQWIFIGAGLWLGFFINLMISLALGGTVAFVISRFSDISKYALALGASCSSSPCWLPVLESIRLSFRK